MLKMYTAYTTELDEEDIALEQIIGQLDLEKNKLKNTTGVILCHSEFIETGIVQHITKNLPFDVVGCTTVSSTTNRFGDRMILTVSMFTSDEIEFSVFKSEEVEIKREENTRKVCERVLACKPEQRPSLVIPFLPWVTIFNEYISNIMGEVLEDVPLFGTVAIDGTENYHESYTFFNGEILRDKIAMLVLWGEVNVKFISTTIPEDRVQKFSSVITKSDQNVVQEINRKPVMEYLEDIGLAKNGVILGAIGIPFMVDYKDNSQHMARAIYRASPEGYVEFAGYMPEGCVVATAAMDDELVIETAIQASKKILSNDDISGFLAFSCASRNYVFLTDRQKEEIEAINEQVGGNITYQMAYAGGEICPIPDASGKLTNKFHNFSFIICIFN